MSKQTTIALPKKTRDRLKERRTNKWTPLYKVIQDLLEKTDGDIDES